MSLCRTTITFVIASVLVFSPAIAGAQAPAQPLPALPTQPAPPSSVEQRPPPPPVQGQTAPPQPVPESQEAAPSAGPRVIADWSEDEPVPPGYHRALRMRRGPIIGGAVTLGTLYMLSTLAAAVAQDNNQGQTNPAVGLWVPALGPFIAIAGSSSATLDWVLVVDGLGQCAGLALLIYGLTTPKTVLMRNDYGFVRVIPQIVPLRDGAAVGLAGEF